MNKKIVIIVVIIVVFIGIFTAVKISKDERKTQTVYSNKAEEAENVENEIANEANNEIIENETVNNVPDEEKDEDEDINTNKETQAMETNKDKAIRIVKNDWGEDDTIYYSYDGFDSNEDYIICVRDKATTKALCWYHVNVETETFEIKY